MRTTKIKRTFEERIYADIKKDFSHYKYTNL